MRLLKLFRFDEFNPDAKADWLVILFRLLFMASVVVVPALYVIIREVFYENPALKYLAVVVCALYVPALVMIRKPKVQITPDYRIRVRNPKTVNPVILKKAVGSAIAYFLIASFATLSFGGSGPMSFNVQGIAPAMREIFTVESPLDFVGIGFFLLLLYVVVGGTLSMLYYQVKYIAHATFMHTAPALSELHPYTRSLIAGTAPELCELRRAESVARLNRLIHTICSYLEVDPSPLSRSIVRQFRRIQETLIADAEWTEIKSALPVRRL